MTLIRMLLVCALIVASGLSCSLLAVSPRSRFKVTDRFPDRLGQVEVFGIEVRSALPDGVVSDENLEKLSGFFADDLQQTTIGLVANINGGADPALMAVILTVDISRLDVPTQEQRKNRVPAYLHGTIALHRVANDRQLGSAVIWAKGSGLNLESNNSPDTVREFASVIRRIVQ